MNLFRPYKKYTKLILVGLFVLFVSGCNIQNENLSSQLRPANSAQLLNAASSSDEVANITTQGTNEEDDIRNFLSKIDEKAISITKGDINLNRKTDFLVEAININCGSCHSRPMYLFEDGRVVFEYQGDDYSVLEAQNNIIKVLEPIRLENEPMCCPSTFQITIISCPKVESQAYCRVKSQSPEKINITEKKIIPTEELSNDNSYVNVDGNQVHSPAYADSIPVGASAICRDGTYSFSQHRQGTCSGHGGVAMWY